MKRWHPLWLSLLLLMVDNPLLAANPAGITVDILERSPRDFGFMLGDTLSQHLRITLPPHSRLNPHTLPTPGRINNWLELRDIRQQATENQYELTLTYQLFKRVSATQTLTIPGSTLLLENGETLTLPVWPISYAPMLENTPTLAALRNPSPPLLRDTQGLQQRLLALLAGLGLCLTCWLWLTQRLPFLPRHPSAFTRALRQMRATEDPEACWQAFQQALSAQAGYTVFPDQLHEFFAAHPRYQKLQASTQTLSGQVHQARFAPQDHTPPTPWPDVHTLRQLCRQFSQLEQAAWTR